MTRLLLSLAMLAACSGPGPDAAAPPRPSTAEADSVADWSRHFAAEGAVGTMVVLDTEARQITRHNPERAAERFSPASTSKVFNALVFLDRGVVSDPDSLWAWDGVERSRTSLNRDHSLRTAVEVSAVWFFQRGALQVGRDGYAEVFARSPWGNATLSDSLEWSWLDGTWRISADEQVVFTDALRRGTLPFSASDQAATRDVVPVLAEGPGGVLRAKTGWGLPAGEPPIGWLVGWVARPEGDVVFALNIAEAPGETLDMGPARLRIARAILTEVGAWPE